MGSHSVTCHPAVVTFPPLPQPKLVLDLATQEECKAQLTWVVVISHDSFSRNAVIYLRNNQAVSWLEIEPATASHKSNVPTTKPPSHLYISFECLQIAEILASYTKSESINTMVTSDFRSEAEIWPFLHAQRKICIITLIYGVRTNAVIHAFYRKSGQGSRSCRWRRQISDWV